MVHDAEVARYNFVLQHGAGWYVDPVSVVSDDDDGALGGRGGRTVILKSCFSEHYSQRDSNKSILKADYNIQAGGQKAWERFLCQTDSHLQEASVSTQKQQTVSSEGQPVSVIVRPSNI